MSFSFIDGIDYIGPSPSVVTFRPGQTIGDQRCSVVSVLDDGFIEDEEMFNLSLSVSTADVDFVKFNGLDISTFTIIQDPNDSKLEAKK